MLGGEGFYRGSSVLVTGTAGTGKSSLAAHFSDASCKSGERVLYFAMEESSNQIQRNMKSIGINLAEYIKQGILRFHAVRPSSYGLEMHLALMHKEINTYNPTVVIIDPLNSLVTVTNESEAKAMAIRLIDFLKNKRITGFFTSLNNRGNSLEHTDIFISSLIDTWILLRDIEIGGERNRGIYILKSRGMAHSNQIREFLLTNNGIKLRDVYVGMEGVLTGSARLAQEAKENNIRLMRQQEIEQKMIAITRKRRAMEAQIEALKAQFEAEEEEIKKAIQFDEALKKSVIDERGQMSKIRKANDRNEN